MSTARQTRPGGSAQFAEERKVATASQVIFTLLGTYIGVPGFAAVRVNGVEYIKDENFTMSTGQMNWIPGSCFAMEAGDEVVIHYQTA
jgi:hypothetical protein